MAERKPLLPTTKSHRRSLSLAVKHYHKAGSRDVNLAMLAERRGLTQGTVDTFRLGVVDNPISGHERFVGMMSIPYLSRDGYPLTVRFRCMEQHTCRNHGHGKYMTISEDQARMFNVPALFNAGDTIHVTEGEIDAMILTQLGYHAIAIPGSSLFSLSHSMNLRGFSKVFVWQDPDEAGREFVSKVGRYLPQAVPVTPHADVNDLFLEGGSDAIHKAVKKANDLHFGGEF